MALFHFHVGQIRRSAGQSVVASAAYRAGEKLYSSYYGEYSDYTGKGGVICSEILLPPQAPPEYLSRSVLWNAVEEAERGKKAQLAYSFDIALQNELTMEENITLARKFLTEQFVSRGMIVDYAVHTPDKAHGGIANPHFHVLCPIRPLDENGKWGKKQRRVYRLDDNGNQILGPDGKPLFDAVPTTDWGKPETLEAWRAAWAELVNGAFEEKGLSCRIDHRSYERQGIDQVPTVHEGVAVRQMEAKGIVTDKGELNRWIRATNRTFSRLRKKLRELLEQIAAIKAELSAPQSPNLAELLDAYFEQRNAGAWSAKARAGNLKVYSETVAMLQRENILTMDALRDRVADLSKQAGALNAAQREKSVRMKELQNLIQWSRDYWELKPVYDHWYAIKFKRSKERYADEHASELRRFQIARRKLREAVPKGQSLPVKGWEAELQTLRQEYAERQEAQKPLWDQYKRFSQVSANLENVLRRWERQHPKEHDIQR